MTNMLSDVYSQYPPEVLYHYTNQAGLLGILESRQIWATHTQYLNDRREYLHALDMVRHHLIVLKTNDQTDALAKEALQAMQDGLAGVEGMCVCVFSLSEKKDSLSQWRAYGGGSGGFAVGISRDTLSEVCKRPTGFKLGKCIYEKKQQEELVAQLIQAVLDEALRLRNESGLDWHEKVGQTMTNHIHQYAPLLKHGSFSDEEEWRLITGPISPIAYDFQFRAGVSTVVPYFRISLDESDEKRFSPKQVVVGPTPNLEDAFHATRLLLVRRGMNECALTGVAQSEVPFRSW